VNPLQLGVSISYSTAISLNKTRDGFRVSELNNTNHVAQVVSHAGSLCRQQNPDLAESKRLYCAGLLFLGKERVVRKNLVFFVV
jgi:hypothetical protein